MLDKLPVEILRMVTQEVGFFLPLPLPLCSAFYLPRLRLLTEVGGTNERSCESIAGLEKSSSVLNGHAT